MSKRESRSRFIFRDPVFPRIALFQQIIDLLVFIRLSECHLHSGLLAKLLDKLIGRHLPGSCSGIPNRNISVMDAFSIHFQVLVIGSKHFQKVVCRPFGTQLTADTLRRPICHQFPKQVIIRRIKIMLYRTQEIGERLTVLLYAILLQVDSRHVRNEIFLNQISIEVFSRRLVQSERFDQLITKEVKQRERIRIEDIFGDISRHSCRGFHIPILIAEIDGAITGFAHIASIRMEFEIRFSSAGGNLSGVGINRKL